MQIFIGIILLIGFILLLTSITETHLLNITEDNLGNNDSDGLKILFFSDIHMSFCFIPVNRVINTIKSNKPDVVIFGGDAINNSRDKNNAIKYLKKISDFCKTSDIRILGVTGNHDFKDGFDSNCFDKSGIELIDGQNIKIDKNNKTYLITGIGDSGRKNRVWYEIPRASEICDRRVLIVHNPDYILNFTYEDSSDKPVDYMISGHIHGGQIRTPWKIEFNKLRKDILPKRGIISGKHIVNDTTIFISKGLGCILLPLRLGARPEINILNIR